MAAPTVLFVCLHGSAKSLIALEHFRRLAQQRGVDVQTDWAGLESDAEIPPRVVQGLLGEGIDRKPSRLPITAEELLGEVMLAPARDRRYCPRGYRHFKEGA